MFLTRTRLRTLLTAAAAVLVVLYLLFASLVFNPLEAEFGELATVVPINSDFLVRWEGASERLADFPRLAIWDDLEETRTIGDLEASGDLARWDDRLGVSRVAAEFERVAAGLPLDIEADLLGREVAIAGKWLGGGRSDWVAFARVSWKVKAGVSLLGYDFVQSRVKKNLPLEELADGRYRLVGMLQGRDVFLTRINDLLLVATKAELLDEVETLDLRSGEGSLGLSANFHDHVTAHLAPGDRPVELYFRWGGMADLIGEWPSPEASGFTTRLARRFFHTGLLNFVSGFWLPGERFLMRLHAGADLREATGFQRYWFDSRALEHTQLRRIAGMVPASSFAYGAVAGTPDRLLLEMVATLDPALRRLIDEAVISTGSYQGMVDIIDSNADALAANAYFSLHSNNYEVSENMAVAHDDAPVPLFAAMFTVRNRSKLDALVDWMQVHYRAFGTAESPLKPEKVTLAGGAVAFAFSTPAIPGTGEIVLVRLKDTFIVGNSHAYVSDVVSTAFTQESSKDGERRKLSAQTKFRESLKRLDRGAHAYLFAEPGKASDWLDQLSAGVALLEFETSMEAAYSKERPAVEQRQRQALFDGRRSLSAIEQQQLRRSVDEALRDRTRALRQEQIPAAQVAVRRKLALSELLDHVFVGLRLSRKTADFVAGGGLAID